MFRSGECSSQTSWAAASDVHENFHMLHSQILSVADLIIAGVWIREGEKGRNQESLDSKGIKG